MESGRIEVYFKKDDLPYSMENNNVEELLKIIYDKFDMIIDPVNNLHYDFWLSYTGFWKKELVKIGLLDIDLLKD